MDIGLILAVSATDTTTLQTIGDWTWRILGVGAGLTFVIFVHELGHFLVAKACGVKCEKFYVGFDFFEFPIPFTPWKIPRSLIKFQWGETEYGLGSLPLGGYVKMLGQDDDPRNAEAEAARIQVAGPGAPDQATAEKTKQPAMADVPTAAEAPVPAKTVEGKTILLDPRSYPAKPVPARMAIISAGVIMNLIFAVILAGIAYKMGVEEVPAVIGGTMPGGAAWTKAIEPGSKLLQVGKSATPYESLRWEDFRAAAVFHNGREVPLLIRRPDGQEVWYEIRPTMNPATKLPMLGIAVPRKSELNIFPEALSHLNPQATQPLKDRDVVVEAAGQKVASGTDLAAIFAQQPRGPLPIKVERRERTKDGKPVANSKQPLQVIDVIVQPKPMRELGMTMKIGPIKAIREGSPAVDAGLRVGDQIVEVDDGPIGEPLSLSQRLTPQAGTNQPVTLVVERKDRQDQLLRRTITVVPEAPLQSPNQVPGDSTSIESIGVAFDVTNEVATVAPDGPAAKAGVRRGDRMTKVEFEFGKSREQLLESVKIDLRKTLELKPSKESWAEVVAYLDVIFPDTKIQLFWLRDEQPMSAPIAPRDAKDFFDESRGLRQYPEVATHTATDWRDALRLGFRETVEQVKQVVMILHSLVTGRVSPTHLSGPLGIIGAAGTVASQGLPALLIFLTILSANLAVLNFLPIPALDGGHMLFLTAEWIRGKPVDERLQIRLTIAGVICLLSLMVFATAMDIGRFAELIQEWFS